VYLSEEGLAHPRRAELERALVAELRRTPGVAYAATVAEASMLGDSAAELDRLVAASATTRQGEILIFTSEGTIVDEKCPRGFGTSHGSPWLYDRTVPVLIGGPGVEHLETRDELPQRAVASTLAALLRVPAPSNAAPEPLPGIRR